MINLEGEPAWADLSASKQKTYYSLGPPCVQPQQWTETPELLFHSLPGCDCISYLFPSPLPVTPDLGFAFCSNKENIFKNLLTLMQREAAIDTVTARE